jgi:signal transduction histidine kinase
MLAHELRNPLAPILPAADILLNAPGDPALVAKIGHMMKRQVDQMAHLIDDLLDVSRITTGKIELRKSRVSVAEVVDRAVESVQPLIERFQHELSIGTIPRTIMIEADPHRLAQVISNLLSNAAKYTAPGGRISLAARTLDGAKLQVAVKDNGKGIKPEHQSRIFDLFDQGSAGAKDGLGIGLTLVRSLVDMHDGTVTVASEGDGTVLVMPGKAFPRLLPNRISSGRSAC